MTIRVAVLGATGLIGQQFLRMLSDHPQFELTETYASAKSVGKHFRDIWRLPFFDYPEYLDEFEIVGMDNVNPDNFDIAFSALPAGIADKLELDLREKGIGVFTNSSPHRMDADVPILIPEINADHIELARIQKESMSGFIISNANCSVTGASIYLHELNKVNKINTSVVSTYQALSGAGLNGVSSLAISDNVIPFIKDEEFKVQIEAKKILGEFENNMIINSDMEVIVNCARVNVVDGHTEAITTFHGEDTDLDELKQKMREISNPFYAELYSAPKTHLEFLEAEDRPQPRLDRLRGQTDQTRGMSVSVGRLRCQNRSVSSFILVHNTIRGGAGGSILNAEFARKLNLI